jgi:dsRNA-specific ribonuclease
MNKALREAIHGALDQMKERCTLRERRAIIGHIKEMMLDADMYTSHLIVDDETAPAAMRAKLTHLPMKMSDFRKIKDAAKDIEQIEYYVAVGKRMVLTYDPYHDPSFKCHIEMPNGNMMTGVGSSVAEAVKEVKSETSDSGEDQ